MSNLPAFAPASNRFRSRAFVWSAAAGVGAVLATSARATIISGGDPIDSAFVIIGEQDILTITTKKGDTAGFNHNANPAQTGQVVVLGSSSTGLAKLSEETLISSASSWSNLTGNRVNEVHFGTPEGDWTLGDTGYFGFSFVDSGNTYYGWGELTYSSSITGTIDAWAYNDVAGEGILTGQLVAAAVPVPEPTTTGLLAGVLVLSGAVWLKKRRRALPAAALSPAQVTDV